MGIDGSQEAMQGASDMKGWTSFFTGVEKPALVVLSMGASCMVNGWTARNMQPAYFNWSVASKSGIKGHVKTRKPPSPGVFARFHRNRAAGGKPGFSFTGMQQGQIAQ